MVDPIYTSNIGHYFRFRYLSRSFVYGVFRLYIFAMDITICDSDPRLYNRGALLILRSCAMLYILKLERTLTSYSRIPPDYLVSTGGPRPQVLSDKLHQLPDDLSIIEPSCTKLRRSSVPTSSTHTMMINRANTPCYT